MLKCLGIERKGSAAISLLAKAPEIYSDVGIHEKTVIQMPNLVARVSFTKVPGCSTELVAVNLVYF